MPRSSHACASAAVAHPSHSLPLLVMEIGSLGKQESILKKCSDRMDNMEESTQTLIRLLKRPSGTKTIEVNYLWINFKRLKHNYINFSKNTIALKKLI